jgi:Putative metal-binding motif
VFLVAVALVAVAAAAPASAWGNHTGPNTGNDLFAGALELEFFSEQQDRTDSPAASIENPEEYTVNAAPPFPELCDGQKMGATLWWFVTGTGGPVTVTTRGSGFDTLLSVFNDQTGEFVDCVDDIPGSFQGEISFPTTAGVTYSLQVGGLCNNQSTCASPAVGRVFIDAYNAPVNDNRGSARTVTAGNPLTAQDNFGATLESGEARKCGDRDYGKTVWYRWVAPATGDAVFSASSSSVNLDPVLTAYLGSGGPVGCNDDVSPSDTQARVGRRVQAGETYFLQVGGFGLGQGADDGNFSLSIQFTPDNDLDDDGSSPPADCNDGNAAIHPGAADINNGIDDNCDGIVDPDRDSDGYARPPLGSDCDDARAGVNPGARDVRGNRVNEDCRGDAAPFRRLRSDTDYSFNFLGSGIVITTPLAVRGVPRGARVALTCRRSNGNQCGKFRERRRRRPIAFEQMDGKQLPAGTVIVIRVTKRNHIGRFIEITIRRGRDPRKDFDCMNPGTSKPRERCPSRR